MRAVLWLVLAILALGGGSARAQRMDASTSARHPTVGDPVIVELRATLPSGAVLVSDTPSVADSVPSGVRVLDAGAMRRLPGGGLAGTARVAFFRTGRVNAPAFSLIYRRSPEAPPDTLWSSALQVDIVPTLPDLNAVAMRDIKDLAPLPGESRVPAWVLAVALVVLVGAVYAVHRARGRRPAGVGAELEEPALSAATPYERAMRRLATVELEGWAARGDVARQYDEITDVVRRYLEEEHGIRALDRTTPELLRALPAALAAGGLRANCGALLDEADLVKFARLRPEQRVADAFLARARALLHGWHEAAAHPAAAEVADAAD